MKKVLFMVVAAAAFSFASCSSEECCECSGASYEEAGVTVEIEDGEVCEDEVEDAGENWGEWKDLYNTAGCDCD